MKRRGAGGNGKTAGGPRTGRGGQAVAWPRVILAIPTERVVHAAAFWSFLAIVQQGWAFMQLPYERTDVARNRMAQQLLESNYSHVLMLDSDHVHPPDIAGRLLRWAKNDPNRLVIAGLYFRRNEPYDPVAMVKKADGYYYGLDEWDQGLLEVDVAGTGAMLISRRVFETLPGPPWFWYSYEGAREGGWPTEDVTFCKLCREHGVKIWLDTTTVSGHLTDMLVHEETFREYMARHPELMTEV